MVTKAELRSFLPGANEKLIDAVVDGWAEADAAGINTPLRKHHFLSNIAVETGGLKAIVENMTYTSVGQLRKTWPTRFKTDAAARPFVRNPEALAIKVYGGRMGNAASPSRDGWLYRGGGMMQTTGRDGYEKMGFEDDPEELQSNPGVAFSVAVREWKKRRCNTMADANDVVAVRRAINGGTNGLDHVKGYLRKAASVWPASGPAKAPSKAPADKVPGKTEKASLRAVQQQLVDLGYPEVGKVDGLWGSKTRAAILAFKADRGLPLTLDLDQGFLAELLVAPKREVSEARATATVADLREAGSTKVAAADKSEIMGYVAAGGGVLTAAGTTKEHLGFVSDLFNQYSGIIDTAKSVGPWLLLGLGAFIVYQQVKLKRTMAQDYREGKYVGR